MNKESLMITTSPKVFWQEIAKEIGGQLEVTKQGQNFGVILNDYYHLRISVMYKGVDILLHSTYQQSPGKFEEYYLDKLRITSEIKRKDKFYLYLWRKSFFEKLFSSSKHHTGDSEFDKTIAFTTNKEREVRNLFSNSAIRKLLVQDKLSVFNIQHDAGQLNIKLQTGQIILNKEILLEEYKKYILFVDGLIEVGLLPTSSQS
ncbi:hypothetical protein [Marinifilum sp. D714]|uniref:hypothetical protein n=1 Tax=Marinifilum sp. D714 TaxID=2937523 RepID=UPI0027BC88F1|nr:hypothetical protein [Marinifilum sp. D714]MDQ2180845.1 hypothetical protein [Marinifilum sp. D714]